MSPHLWSHWPDRIMAVVAVVALVASFWTTSLQLRISLDTARLSQRPWVVVDQLSGSSSTIALGSTMTIPIIWKNSGQGPARSVRLFNGYVSRPTQTPLPSIWTFDGGSSSNHSTTAIVGPGAQATLVLDLAFDAEHLDQIRTGQRTLNLIGWATYLDVFNQKHWTTFCAVYLPNQQAFDICEEGNETDDPAPTGLAASLSQ